MPISAAQLLLIADYSRQRLSMFTARELHSICCQRSTRYARPEGGLDKGHESVQDGVATKGEGLPSSNCYKRGQDAWLALAEEQPIWILSKASERCSR